MAGMLGVVICTIVLLLLLRFAWLRNKCACCLPLFPRDQKSWRLKKVLLFPLLALAAFLAALAFRETEAKEGEPKCDSMGVFQQHSMWHMMCACALLALYFLYRVEHIEYYVEAIEVATIEEIAKGEEGL